FARLPDGKLTEGVRKEGTSGGFVLAVTSPGQGRRLVLPPNGGKLSTLGPKSLHDRLLCRQGRAPDQVDAIRNGRENGQQAIADRTGLSGQIHDQRASPDAGNLPREDRRWHNPQ